MIIQITTELLIKIVVAILLLILLFKVLKIQYLVFSLIYGVYLATLKRNPEKWSNYQGKIFLKECIGCLEFFKHVRSRILSTCPDEGTLIFTGGFRLKDFPEEYKIRLRVTKEDGKIPDEFNLDNTRFEILTSDFNTILFSTDRLYEIKECINRIKNRQSANLGYSNDYYRTFHKFYLQITASTVRVKDRGIIQIKFTPNSGWVEE